MILTITVMIVIVIVIQHPGLDGRGAAGARPARDFGFGVGFGLAGLRALSLSLYLSIYLSPLSLPSLSPLSLSIILRCHLV